MPMRFISLAQVAEHAWLMCLKRFKYFLSRGSRLTFSSLLAMAYLQSLRCL